MSPMSFGTRGARRWRWACDEGADPFASRRLAERRLIGRETRPFYGFGYHMMGRAAPLPELCWKLGDGVKKAA